MNLRDTLVLIGLSAAFVGLWWMYPPIALVIGGAVVAGAGVLSHFANRPKDNQ